MFTSMNSGTFWSYNWTLDAVFTIEAEKVLLSIVDFHCMHGREAVQTNKSKC